MKLYRKFCTLAALAFGILCLAGCVMTVDQMYVPPRRSESYRNLQAVMDAAMGEMEYCAPVAGENQQTVQMADLNGDGLNEVVVFVRENDEHPLKIYLFQLRDGEYEYLNCIESTGTAFNQVEYIQMDGLPGLELVVGRQVSDQVMGNVTVYRFDGGQPEQLMSVNYSKFLTMDMNRDGRGDLFVLRPGLTDADPGVVELYSADGETVTRSAEVMLSQPVSQLKRIMTGSLEDGHLAVFVASMVDSETIVTDVYALMDGKLTNVSVSNESGTSVKTVRNYYVYSEDIDQDGVLELPSLIATHTPDPTHASEKEHFIRWYAIDSEGREHDKCYTYHNYLQGWYLKLDESYVGRLCVLPEGMGRYTFYYWSRDFKTMEKVWTIYVLTGEERSNVAVEDGRFVLLKTDTVVYSCYLEEAAQKKLGITREELTENFFLIQSDWKTGEM